MKGTQEDKREKARKRVQDVKKFHWYVITTVLASLMSLGMAYFFSTQNAPYFIIAMFLFAPIMFALVGIIYYSTIMGHNWVFGNKWEERQIRQYIEKEKKQAEKSS